MITNQTLKIGALYLIATLIVAIFNNLPYLDKPLVFLTGFLFQIFFSVILYIFFLIIIGLIEKISKPYFKLPNLFKGLSFFFFQSLILFISTIVLFSKNEWGYPANFQMTSEAFPHTFSLIKNLPAHYNAPFYLMVLTILTVILFIYSIRVSSLISDSILKNKKNMIMGVLCGIGLVGLFSFKSTHLVQTDPLISFFDKTEYDLFTGTTKKIGLESLAVSYDKIEDFDKKNIILVTIDCLRADHLDFNGYPRKTTPYLSSLYESGNLQDVDIATSSCSISWCGILSTLFSKAVSNLHVFNFGIHDYLKVQGYKNHFILSGMHSSFLDLKTSYGESVDFYREGKQYDQYNFNDDRVLLEGVKELEASSEKPSFFYIHMMGPHQVGVKLPHYSKFHPSRPDKFFLMDNVDRYRGLGKYKRLAINHYDNGLYQSDQILEQIMDSLKTKGYLDDFLLVVLGDHGESFGEHNASFIHGRGLWQNYIGIPILIYDSKGNKKNLNTNYGSQIDIGPTIVDRLGLPIPDVWEGISLYDTINKRTTYHEQKIPGEGDRKHYAVIEKDDEELRKYIFNDVEDNEEVYDLIADPDELNNLKNLIDEEELQGYRKKLNAFYEESIFTSSINIAKDSLISDTTISIEIPSFCYILGEDKLKSQFNATSDIFQVFSVSKNLKSCRCTSTWASNESGSRTVLLQVKNQHPRFVIDFFKNKGYRKNKEEYYQFLDLQEDIQNDIENHTPIWSEEGKVLIWGGGNKFSYVLEDYDKDNINSKTDLLELAEHINLSILEQKVQ